MVFQEVSLLIAFVYSSLDEILPGLERYGALKKEFEEYHEKLEREQVSQAEKIYFRNLGLKRLQKLKTQMSSNLFPVESNN